ncbi:MAG: hypothetical protein AABW67_00370 [Nanoarchaeota archaeon]
MNKQVIRTEFWVSPQYNFSCNIYPTDKKTEFAMMTDGIDGKDHMFKCDLEDCTFSSESERMIFDGKAYCQIRTNIVKINSGELKEEVVRGTYGRTIRLDIMPSESETPKILKEILAKAGYELSNYPSNNIIISKSGLLNKL